jgi:GlcNAc-PI de-N-acetylase
MPVDGSHGHPRVVISSHPDDAVLSAYSVLSPATTVITVLAGIPPRGSLGDWDAEGGATDSHVRMLERHEEDHVALAVSGARAHHLDFADRQYVEKDILPTPTLDEIGTALEPYLQQASEIYAPAGIGHVDHALVRDGVLAVRADAVLYADLPYALRPEHGGFTLPPISEGATRSSRTVQLESSLAQEKARAFRCYTTQLERLDHHFPGCLTPASLSREVFWTVPTGTH